MANSYSSRRFGRSLIHYVGGRLGNAVAAFVIFAWLARYLPEQDYANYIAAYACLELGLVIFGFGMEWVTAVYIPQVRVKGTPSALRRFVWECALIQALLLLLGSLIFALLAPVFTDWLGLSSAAIVFGAYALVMFVEGASRVFRDQLLACLLQQGASQISQGLRNASMLAFALMLPWVPQWCDAFALARAELLASSLSLLLSIVLLYRCLQKLEPSVSEDRQWRRPAWSIMLRAGGNAWLSNLANLSWGGQVVILLATRLIGAESTAALGFARNLSEQVRRYLPMEFLFGVIRPMLIARFAEDGNVQSMELRAALMYRANLLFLMPLLVLVGIRGEELCSLLSNGRYGAAHWLLFGWLSVLIFWAHHRLTDLLAHALHQSATTRRVALPLMLTTLLLSGAAYYKAWVALFSILAMAECLYSLVVLRVVGVYRLNQAALLKLFAGALPAVILLALPYWPTGLVSLLLQAFAAYGIQFAFVFILRPWSAEEFDSIPWASRFFGERMR
jgi:O-antigen/teichoic acid export membrane protein